MHDFLLYSVATTFPYCFTAHPDDGSRVFTAVCLRDCFSPHDISKTDAARITKLGKQIFHDESWKPIHFEGQKVKVTSHKNSAGVRLCTLVNAGF